MALWGLPAGAGARPKALGCDSSSSGYQAGNIPHPLPGVACPPQCLLVGPFGMVRITMMTLPPCLQGALHRMGLAPPASPARCPG